MQMSRRIIIKKKKKLKKFLPINKVVTITIALKTFPVVVLSNLFFIIFF